MLTSRTPFRISFFGGGTDYPAWYREEGGAVLSTTIDKYCYLSCRVLPPYFNVKHRIVWSHIETVNSINEILHPAVREGMRMLGFDDRTGLEIHHMGDLPARTGVGSSSAFAVGLINGLMNLNGRQLDKKTLAQKAIELERDILKENVGSQDQVASAYGGLNLIHFERDGKFDVQPVKLPKERLAAFESSFMLFYAGMNRLGSEIALGVIKNIPQKRETFRQIRQQVDKAHALLTGNGSLDDFGRMLHEGWKLKSSLGTGVTNDHIDGLYNRAINAGALGGKLMGAGGTGFLLFYVPAEKQAVVRQALADCLCVPFKFENFGSVLVNDERVYRARG